MAKFKCYGRQMNKRMNKWVWGSGTITRSGDLKYAEKTHFHCYIFHSHQLTYFGLGSKLGVPGEKSAKNRLNQGHFSIIFSTGFYCVLASIFGRLFEHDMTLKPTTSWKYNVGKTQVCSCTIEATVLFTLPQQHTLSFRV